MQSRKLIVGNWKMNGLVMQGQEIVSLAKHLEGQIPAWLKVVVCPPATLQALAANLLGASDIEFGGQDCSPHAKGAHTGDLSAAMFADLGATYLIVGHSERRADHGETDVIVVSKAQAVLAAGLTPIICVGESEAQRDAGQAEAIVLGQIAGSIPQGCNPENICIAYEPVWAIGTGKIPSVQDVASIHAAIRGALQGRFGTAAGAAIAILYGGSVNGANAASLLDVANVDGALVGGASLTADSFIQIIASQL